MGHTGMIHVQHTVATFLHPMGQETSFQDVGFKARQSPRCQALPCNSHPSLCTTPVTCVHAGIALYLSIYLEAAKQACSVDLAIPVSGALLPSTHMQLAANGTDTAADATQIAYLG